jgi:cell division protein FtsN
MKLDLRKEGSNNANKRFKLELSMSGLIGLSSVTLLGLIWVFIFGVLVGRGYQPERAVPKLAQIMPSPTPSVPQPQVAENKEEKTSKEVLKPEELQFYDKLKDSPDASKDKKAHQLPLAAQPSLAASPTASKPGASQDKNAKSATGTERNGKDLAAEGAGRLEPAKFKAESAAKDGKDAKAKEIAKAEKEAKDAKQTVEREPKEGRFAYVYQVASLPDAQSALRYRDQVRGLGFNAEVTQGEGNGKTWHRVVVHFKGKPEDTRELKAKLKAFGVDKPLLRSKSPLNQ